MRTQHITDEIIDAIIQNEGRHVERPGRPGTPVGAVPRRLPAPPPERPARRESEDPETRRQN
jgi:hypothetical protein